MTTEQENPGDDSPGEETIMINGREFPEDGFVSNPFFANLIVGKFVEIDEQMEEFQDFIAQEEAGGLALTYDSEITTINNDGQVTIYYTLNVEIPLKKDYTVDD